MPTAQTPQRLQLGRALRAWRDQRGMSRDAVAEGLACRVEKVGKIETGHATVTPLELRTLLALYEVPTGAETEKLVALAEQARRRPQQRVPEWLRAYVSLEAEAARVESFRIDLIPGLLQTEPYIRAIATAHDPSASDAEIERLVAIRQERQARLSEATPLKLHAIIHEAAIRTVVGGADVMRDQTTRLLDLASLPNVAVQLVPYSAGAHASMGVSFTIVELPPPSNTQVAYTESMWSADYVEEKDQVRAYSQLFDRLTRAALDEASTRVVIEDVIKELS